MLQLGTGDRAAPHVRTQKVSKPLSKHEAGLPEKMLVSVFTHWAATNKAKSNKF
jgi:hypothetical protein